MSVSGRADWEGLRHIGRVVALTLQRMRDALRPGITTAELNALGEGVLAEHGARSAPQLVYNFPAATCISVNEEVAHGIPGLRVIEPGDLVHIDVSAELHGYFADTGASVPVAPVRPEIRSLCRRTRRALKQIIETVHPNAPLSTVGRIVEREARRGGFAPIRDLCSHGIGRALHEPPKEIPNIQIRQDRRRFTNGLVVALEPFLCTGSGETVESDDGWTIRTPDGSVAAQYEHTVVVTDRGGIIVTQA